MDRLKELEKHLRDRLAILDEQAREPVEEGDTATTEEARIITVRQNEVMTALLILLNGPDWSA